MHRCTEEIGGPQKQSLGWAKWVKTVKTYKLPSVE